MRCGEEGEDGSGEPRSGGSSHGGEGGGHHVEGEMTLVMIEDKKRVGDVLDQLVGKRLKLSSQYIISPLRLK